MVTILHGDDTSKSRNYFLELKQKQKNAVFFEAGKFTITDLVQNTEGSGLFEDTKIIFIENLLTKLKKKELDTKEIINCIVKNSKESAFILWESKELSKRELMPFKDVQIKSFKLPKNIFVLLDNLKPNNSRPLVNLFHQALDSGINEDMILYMLQRQFRLLLALSDPGEKSIDEMVRLAPWQMEKLERQAKLFTVSELKKIYKKLFEMEIGQKTGSLNLSLIQSIDFLLLEM